MTTLDRAVIISLALTFAVSVALPVNWPHREALGLVAVFAFAAWYAWWGWARGGE